MRLVNSVWNAPLALLLCAFLPVASGQTSDWIRIGSWNIENLPRGTGQTAPALAEHILLAGLDLLALQEIHVTGTGPERKNDRLDEVIAILNQQTNQSWTYVLFPNKNQQDTSQLCGFAWNTRRLAMVGSPFRIPVVDDPADQFNAWDRHPHAARFSAGTGKTDIVAISVHMKSNADGEEFGRQQRAEEARRLVDQLPAVRTNFAGDRDLVILGDTNCLDRNEPALTSFSSAGFQDLNASDFTTFVSGRAPFDRILVPRNQPEFRFTRQYILRAADLDAHERSLSDHQMVIAAVRIMPDDDQ